MGFNEPGEILNTIDITELSNIANKIQLAMILDKIQMTFTE